MLDITPRKEAEAKAEAAEERFRRLAELSPVVVYEYELLNADPARLTVRYVSPNAETLLKMPLDRWIGDVDAWFDHLHPDDVGWMRESAQGAFATGEPWSQRFRMIAGDGRVVWLLHRGRAVEHDPSGRPTVFQGIFIDVTEEQESHLEIAASEARHRTIVESLPAVPWSEVVDPTTSGSRYVYMGPQVEALLGYDRGELTEPDRFFRLVHPDDRDRLKAASDRCHATGEPWDALYRATDRDGSVRWLLSRATRTSEERRSVWHGITVDVTRHVEAGAISARDGTELDAEPA
jgi:PAS domain S-box-containing protein